MDAEGYLQSLYDVSFLKELFDIGDTPMNCEECMCFLQQRGRLICELQKYVPKKLEVD